jgi:hypothetical protein
MSEVAEPVTTAATEPQAEPQNQAPPQTTNPSTDDLIAKTFRVGQAEAYSHVDNVLKELGYEKPSNLKTSEFVKQIISEKLTTQPQTTNSEIEEKYNALKSQYEQLNNKYTTAEQNFIKKQAQIAIDAAFDSLSIPTPPIEDSQKDGYVAAQKETIKTLFDKKFETKVINERTVYYDKTTGQPVLDNTGDYATNVKDIVKNAFPHFFIEYAPATPTARGVRTPDAPSTNTPKLSTSRDILEYMSKKMEHLKVGTPQHFAE